MHEVLPVTDLQAQELAASYARLARVVEALMHGRGASLATEGVGLVEIYATCPNRKKPVKVTAEQISWSHNSAECELCGDHGYCGAEYKFPCGERHFLLLDDW